MIRNILKKKNISKEYGLRMSIKGGNGCSGMRFTLGFDKQKDNDKSFEDKGLTIVVDKKSMLYLLGTNLEYEGGLNGKGFSFRNPNNTNREAGS